jgi:hypothetical protein
MDPSLQVAKRRASYDAERLANIKLHKERVEQAKKSVREHLEQWKPLEDFTDRVITKVLFAAQLSVDSVSPGIEVTSQMIEECGEAVAKDWAGEKVEQELARNGVRSSQLCRVIGKNVFEKCGWGELIMSESSGSLNCVIGRSVKQLVDSQSSCVACPICMDPLLSFHPSGAIDASRMWCAPARKNEHWSNHACGHTFCRSCMEQWAETEINDGKLRIKCPAECCSYSLWEQDLAELVSVRVLNRYREHKHADYLKHLQDISEKDDSLMRWLRQHARPCPSCHVIVSRSEGCNVMTCVCGCRFCYSCGCTPCQCGSEKSQQRQDIWRPE